jgi:hypothetical protein
MGRCCSTSAASVASRPCNDQTEADKAAAEAALVAAAVARDVGR